METLLVCLIVVVTNDLNVLAVFSICIKKKALAIIDLVSSYLCNSQYNLNGRNKHLQALLLDLMYVMYQNSLIKDEQKIIV